MLKKLLKVGENHELGYNDRVINDIWLVETEKGFKKAPFSGLGKKGWVEEYRTVGIGGKTPDEAKKAQGQV